jgi:hypothetical protein
MIVCHAFKYGHKQGFTQCLTCGIIGAMAKTTATERIVIMTNPLIVSYLDQAAAQIRDAYTAKDSARIAAAYEFRAQVFVEWGNRYVEKGSAVELAVMLAAAHDRELSEYFLSDPEEWRETGQRSRHATTVPKGL